MMNDVRARAILLTLAVGLPFLDQSRSGRGAAAAGGSLVGVCDLYFSIWSPADRLTDADTVHSWTGEAAPFDIPSAAITDTVYRVIGGQPAEVPGDGAEEHLRGIADSHPRRTLQAAGVELRVTFMTAALPDDIDMLSRPVTYVTYESSPRRGRQVTRSCQIFFMSALGELCAQHARATGRVARADRAVSWRAEDRVAGTAGAGKDGRRLPHRLGVPGCRGAAGRDVASRRCRIARAAAWFRDRGTSAGSMAAAPRGGRGVCRGSRVAGRQGGGSRFRVGS